MRKSNRPIGSILISLGILLSACTTSVQTAVPTLPAVTTVPVAATATVATTPTSVSTATPAPIATVALSETPQPAPTENPVHAPGQLIKGKNVWVAVIGTGENKGQLQVTLAAKNIGATLVGIGLFQFTAVTAGGTKLKTDNCVLNVDPKTNDLVAPNFASTLQPGEVLKGMLCWKIPVPGTGVQVTFSDSDNGPVVASWDVSKPGTADVPAEIAASDGKTTLHAQGEAVTVKDLTITFNGITLKDTRFTNKLVLANFTIQNNGAASFKFTSAIGNSFDLKSTDGYPYLVDFMSAGCMTSATLAIAPKQSIKVDMCYITPSITVGAGIQARYLAPDASGFFSQNPADIITWTAK